MRAIKVREKSAKELAELKVKSARDLMDAKFKNITGQLNDKSQIKKLRKDIARINTIIKEKV